MPFTANEWHHFAAVIVRDPDPANQELRLYVDGGTPVVKSGLNWGSNPIQSSATEPQYDVRTRRHAWASRDP